MCACVPALSPLSSDWSVFSFSWASSDVMCTSYQLQRCLAFQELVGLVPQSGAQVMVVYFMFNFVSQVAELNQAAVLTAAGKRLSEVPLSLCRPLACRSCLPFCFFLVHQLSCGDRIASPFDVCLFQLFNIVDFQNEQ